VQPLDLEARRADPVEGGAVAVTAAAKSRVDRQQPVLPASHALVLGAHVLHEQQASARAQHAPQLAKRARLVIDRAQHERRDRGVEAVVLEGKVFSRCAQHLGVGSLLLRATLQAADHRLLRLGDREALHSLPVPRQVRAGASADLQHLPARAGEQRLAMRGQSLPFALGHEAVVHRREDPAPDTHVVSLPIEVSASRTCVRSVPTTLRSLAATSG
jgi:hypothetical protein